MARDQCSQVDKRQLIVRVFLTLQAEAFMVAPKEQRPGEPSEEALMSLSKENGNTCCGHYTCPFDHWQRSLVAHIHICVMLEMPCLLEPPTSRCCTKKRHRLLHDGKEKEKARTHVLKAK